MKVKRVLIRDAQGEVTGILESGRALNSYGGDEPGMAEQVAQRIQTGLQTDNEEPALSVSMGIGIYPDHGRTAAELIEAADRQLYRYKTTENRRTLPATGRMLRSKRAGR